MDHAGDGARGRALQASTWAAAEVAALRDGIVAALIVPNDVVSVSSDGDLATAALSLASPAVEQRSTALITTINDGATFLAAVQQAAPLLASINLELTVTARVTNLVFAPSLPPPPTPEERTGAPPPPLTMANVSTASALTGGAGDDADGATPTSSIGMIMMLVVVVILLLVTVFVIVYCRHKRQQTERRSRTGGPMPFAVPATRTIEVMAESATSDTRPSDVEEVLPEVIPEVLPATVLGAPVHAPYTRDPRRWEADPEPSKAAEAPGPAAASTHDSAMAMETEMIKI